MITQNNPTLRLGASLTTLYQVSSLTSTFITALLTSPSLPSLIELNSERLSRSYKIISSTLRELNLDFIPANAGLFVFVKVAPGATTWDEEAAVVEGLRESGVIVSPGKPYNGNEEEKGWARITFAVPEDVLIEGMARLKSCIAQSGN